MGHPIKIKTTLLHTFTWFAILFVHKKDQFEKSSSRTQSGEDDIIEGRTGVVRGIFMMGD